MTDLSRFVEAQNAIWPRPLDELRAGRKRSHWMWFILPQIAGLGQSAMAQRYALAAAEEARAWLDHPLLGDRYRACIAALQALPGSDPVAVMGDIDAMKLRSSLTLFEAASPEPLFADALDRWFDGVRDAATLARI